MGASERTGPGAQGVEGWPVARATGSRYVVFGLPDRLGDGNPYTSENYATFRSLEELGVDDWNLAVLNALVPVDRCLAVWASAATWHLTRRSRPRRDGRLDRVQGLRWKHYGPGWIFATVPAGVSTDRQAILEFIGYDSEQQPEVVFVLHDNTAPGVTLERPLVHWCRERKLWRDPGRIVPELAERVILLYNGWMHIAVETTIAPAVMRAIEELAAKWGIPLIEGPPEWAWPA
jgi:hypothetical protein